MTTRAKSHRHNRQKERITVRRRKRSQTINPRRQWRRWRVRRSRIRFVWFLHCEQGEQTSTAKHAAIGQLFNCGFILQQEPSHQDLEKQKLHDCESKWRRSKNPQEGVRQKLRRSMVWWESYHEHHVPQEWQGEFQSHLWQLQRRQLYRPQAKRSEHQVKNASRRSALSWHGEQTDRRTKTVHSHYKPTTRNL